jgi:hypothetical protein
VNKLARNIEGSYKTAKMLLASRMKLKEETFRRCLYDAKRNNIIADFSR